MATLPQAERDAPVLNPEMKPVKVGDLVGKPLVLVFFPAAFTSVCTTELCTFRDSMTRFNALDARVYGLSIDTPFTMTNIDKIKATFEGIAAGERLQ